MTKEQALCIARRAGLEVTARPWTIETDVHYEFEAKENLGRRGETVWVVRNVLKPPGRGAHSRGRLIEISKRDGKILRMEYWGTVTVE